MADLTKPWLRFFSLAYLGFAVCCIYFAFLSPSYSGSLEKRLLWMGLSISALIYAVLSLPSWRDPFASLCKFWKDICCIWNNEYPNEPPNKLQWFERVVMGILSCLGALALCRFLRLSLWPANAPKPNYYKRNLVDCYVPAASIALGAMLFWGTGGEQISCWVVGIAIYLMAEMVVTTLCVQFVDRYMSHWGVTSPNRSIMLLFLGYAELILGFAILYLAFGGIEKNESCLKCLEGVEPETLTESFDALYFSLVTITTLGYGEWVPTDGPSKWLVVIEVSFGILLIVLMLSAFVNRLGDEKNLLPCPEADAGTPAEG